MATTTAATGTSSAGSVTRITGMVTGIDTDATVKALMQGDQTRLDSLKAAKQKTQWQQDLYREIVGDINTFKSSSFDVLQPDNYMLSSNTYSNYDISTFDAGTATPSSGVTVTAGSGATAGSYSIDFGGGGSIAVGAGVTSANSITGATAAAKLADLGITTTQMSVTYNDSNGVFTTKDINIDPNTMSLSDLAQAINTGTNAAVNAKFSELTGKFTVQQVNTGANTKLSLTDDTSGNILEKLNLSLAGGNNVSESDAGYGITPTDLKVKITPPGGTPTIITKPVNTFTADGITYKFTSATKNADVTVTANTQKTFDKVKNFIDKYNTMIDQINTKINEQKQSAYPPLTDAQKASMTTQDITNWETQAKKGLLGNDSMLEGMLTSMRSAFYSTVKGAGITLSDIGLSTSSDIAQGGKIIIDATKLKSAIQTNGDKVAKIFSQQSTSFSTYSPDLTRAQRDTRASEEGISQRINDILQDYTRTTRDSGGNKGILISKAGVQGDYTEFNNLITNDLNSQQKYIDDFVTRMSAKQDSYYAKFANLESAMNNLNKQNSALASLGVSSSK
jgi:flagellar hook-associated protein 2